jgi:hypothetical protein
MNKRQAKKEAYFAASLMLKNVLAGGWTCCDNSGFTESDGEKVDAALRDIVRMLEDRGSICVELPGGRDE